MTDILTEVTDLRGKIDNDLAMVIKYIIEAESHFSTKYTKDEKQAILGALREALVNAGKAKSLSLEFAKN